MKKMVFSAVALVAFSFAGMANNEVKEIKKEETKKEVAKEKQLDCNTVRQLAYLQAMADGFSDPDATGMAYSVYFNCLGWAL